VNLLLLAAVANDALAAVAAADPLDVVANDALAAVAAADSLVADITVDDEVE